MRVLHVNHGVRGAAAEADAEFVVNLAMGLDLSVRVARSESNGGKTSEAALRAFRQTAVNAACAREAVAAIFTGHQADDVAENLLFRLSRGSGLRGLSGMRPVQTRPGQPPRLRPLLLCSRGAIREVLRAAGVEWTEDASNASMDFTRNRLRAATVPAWKEAIRDRSLLAGIRRSHQHLREAEVAIEQWATRISNAFSENKLVLDVFVALPLAVRRRVLARWWRRHSEPGAPLSDDTIDRLLEWANEGGADRFILGPRTLTSDGSCWTLVPTQAHTAKALGAREWTLSPDTLLELPSGETLSLSWRVLDDALREAICEGRFSPSREVSLDLSETSIRVRGWRPGDRYRPLGAPGSKKLQDAFTDAGIPRERRHELPVVCDAADNILWVPGLAPAEACRVGSSTTRALWLTYGGT